MIPCYLLKDSSVTVRLNLASASAILLHPQLGPLDPHLWT